MTARAQLAAVVVGLGLAALALVGCSASLSPSPTDSAVVATSAAELSSAATVVPSADVSLVPASSPPAASPPAAGALALLATVPVKGRAPKTGYTRDQFGPAWADDNDDPLGRNGCDTRDDVLRRDLTQTVIDSDCQVKSGLLADPYTGLEIHFTEGAATSGEVQIDHVVALGDAWQTGAQYWSPTMRQDLANDPLNLLAVDGRSNAQKGDSDAASWLPPAKSYRCAYVARQIAVKARYGLWVTAPEAAAMKQVLRGCPSQPVPVEAARAAPTAASSPPLVPSSTGSAAGSAVYYANCAAVRAAGRAPLRRGQPGYRAGLDGDNDGIACQSG